MLIAYNGDGHRVFKDDGTVVKRFVYDGNTILREVDELGLVEAEYTYTPQPYGHLISQERAGDSSFYHFDGIGNVRALTDNLGVQTDEYLYDAWGKAFSTTGTTSNPFTYKGEAGYYRDPDLGPENDNYTLHHRHYAAGVGRFRSMDPARDDANLYRYVRNNPVNSRDPSGLAEVSSSVPLSGNQRKSALFRDIRNSSPYRNTGAFRIIDGRPWELSEADLDEIRRATDTAERWTAAFSASILPLAYTTLEESEARIANEARQYRSKMRESLDGTDPWVETKLRVGLRKEERDHLIDETVQTASNVADIAFVVTVAARAAGKASGEVLKQATETIDDGASLTKIEVSQGTAALPTSGVDLQLYYKPGWTDAQRAAAKQKAHALTEADTVVVKNPQRSGTSASSRYRQAGNTVPAGSDVDHVVDLQLGGADDTLNMRLLDASVNRSLGSQIQHRIRHLAPGTPVNRVIILDRH